MWEKTRTYINSIMKQHKIKNSSLRIITDNKIAKPEEICVCFNSHFTTIERKLLNSFTATINPLSFICSNNYSFFLNLTSQHEILKIICDLSTYASGYDDVHSIVMKYESCHIATPLSHMINCSLSTGIVPSKLKISKVIPILKNNQQHVLSNYRPISILPRFSKILEKAV